MHDRGKNERTRRKKGEKRKVVVEEAYKNKQRVQEKETKTAKQARKGRKVASPGERSVKENSEWSVKSSKRQRVQGSKGRDTSRDSCCICLCLVNFLTVCGV